METDLMTPKQCSSNPFGGGGGGGLVLQGSSDAAAGSRGRGYFKASCSIVIH